MRFSKIRVNSPLPVPLVGRTRTTSGFNPDNLEEHWLSADGQPVLLEKNWEAVSGLDSRDAHEKNLRVSCKPLKTSRLRRMMITN